MSNDSDMLAAADTARMQSGGRSMWDKISDAATAGTAGAVVSGLSSIYNTGVSVANLFGADAEEIDTAHALRSVNDNWATYYEENKNVVDTVGFIGGAFIPGGLALKGLKYVREGKSFGSFGSVLRYTQNKQADYLKAALAEVETAGGGVYARLNANKLASMAFGAADNVLQTAVFETAAAVTMHSAPIFAGESYGDITWDIVKTSLLGGAIGGGVEALFTNKIFRDASKLVDRTQRKYDTIATMKNMGLDFGDETFHILDAVQSLPREVLEADKKINFKFRLNGKDDSVEIKTADLFEGKLKDTTSRALQLMHKELTNVVASDKTVGAPLGRALIDIVNQSLKGGASPAQAREQLGNILFGLKTVERTGAVATDYAKEIFYLSRGAEVLEAGKGTQALFSPTRVLDTDRAYRIIGKFQDVKLGVVGIDAPTQAALFDAGFDMAMSNVGGKITVSPNSKIFQETNFSGESPLKSVFNTHSLRSSTTSELTVADIASPTRKFNIEGGSVQSGNFSAKFTLDNYKNTIDTIHNTARHAWAATLKKVENTTVSVNDFSVLDAMVQTPSIVGKDVKVKDTAGTLIPWESILDKQAFVTDRKLSELVRILNETQEAKAAIQKTFDPSATLTPKMRIVTPTMKAAAEDIDVRKLAYKLNAEHSWVEDAVTHEFDNTKLTTPAASRDLAGYHARENIVMVYDQQIRKAMEDGDFTSSQLAYQYRKQGGTLKTDEGATAVLREDAGLFPAFSHEELTKKADATGVGAKAFSSSNADYGDVMRNFVQYIGTLVSQVGSKRANGAVAKLQAPAAELITNAKDGAELAAIVTKGRRSEEALSLFDGKIVDLASKEKAVKKMQAWDGKGMPPDITEADFKTSITVSPRVYNFLQAHHDLHGSQLHDKITLANAQGTPIHWNPDRLYFPPIDTQKFPYFAFVREVEGKVFGTSEVAMITARNPEELRTLAAGIPKEYQVIYKVDTEDYFKAKGDYDYTRTLNAPRIDPFLRSQGKLGDFTPSLDAKATVEDFVTYHARKEQQLVRDAVSVKYAQTFNELQWLSDTNTRIEKSKLSFLGIGQQRTITDPFGDYIKTALNVSKKSEFSLWHQANEFVDALGTRAYQLVEKATQDARAGKITWEEGNELMTRMGLGSPFTMENFIPSQIGNDRNLIRQAVAKGNMLLATLGLRLDMANALLNVISTPIMLGTELQSIRRSIANDPELSGKLAMLTNVVDPATGTAVPSTTKLIANAIKNYWTPEGKEMVKGRYKDIGAIKDILTLHHDMMDDLALTPNLVPKEWAKKVGSWADKGSAITGNNFAEQFTRFVSADVMRQLTDPLILGGKMSVKEQNAYISIFTNRVQGNYIASQRPIAFQGTIGAAIGLFQTYQFNMFQQLFRHIENRDGKAIAVMGGLQTTVFGLNGLPMFDAINTQLIGQANINEGHRDAYSFAVQASNAVTGGKGAGDWLMYGTASAFPFFSEKMPALFTRGDLNPRHVTVIPTAPDQLPIYEAGSRVVSNLAMIAKQLGSGADVLPTLLFGLEHNGVNRPLAGIAQSLQGFSTTSQGSLISSTSDYSSIANASRVLGARPMDEALGLNTKFRLDGYRAADRARIESLGTTVKEKIRSGTLTSEDVLDFQSRYAAVGGRMETFGAAMQRWHKGATQSVLNTMMESSGTSRGQRLNEIMGADPIEDLKGAPMLATQ